MWFEVVLVWWMVVVVWIIWIMVVVWVIWFVVVVEFWFEWGMW